MYFQPSNPYNRRLFHGPGSVPRLPFFRTPIQRRLFHGPGAFPRQPIQGVPPPIGIYPGRPRPISPPTFIAPSPRTYRPQALPSNPIADLLANLGNL